MSKGVWQLRHCPICNQMTNHDGDGCLKCSVKQPNKLDMIIDQIWCAGYNKGVANGNDDNTEFIKDMRAGILAWHETEKQKLLKQIWNLSQPDIVPDGWKPETKLSKWLKDNIK